MYLYLCNFVRRKTINLFYRDPTPQVNELLPIKWEPVTETGLAYLYIDENLKMKDELYPARTKLFKDLFAKYDLLSA